MTTSILVISNYRSTHTVRPEAEIFIGLAKMGAKITIMTYGDSEYVQKFEEAGIKVIDFHPQKKFDRQEINFIREELIRGQYDILQLYNSKAIINGIRAAKGLAVKVVLYRGFTGNIHWYDPAAYVKFLHPRVDKIICNSKGVEQMFRRQLFFKKEKAITINKGHLLAWYEGISAIDLQILGIPTEAFVVTCVANNRKMKGIPYLLKASYYLPTDLPIHILLVGNGMDTPEQLQLAKESPNGERIHFVGFRKDGLHIVKASHVFILASIFGESITKSVIEAMALETAPIITDIPGNTELVDDGKSGLVVPAHDPEALAKAMVRLYENPELLAAMSQAAKHRIRTHLNHQHTLNKMKKLYEELQLR